MATRLGDILSVFDAEGLLGRFDFLRLDVVDFDLGEAAREGERHRQNSGKSEWRNEKRPLHSGGTRCHGSQPFLRWKRDTRRI